MGYMAGRFVGGPLMGLLGAQRGFGVVLLIEAVVFATLPIIVGFSGPGARAATMGVLTAAAVCFGVGKVGIPSLVAAIFPMRFYGAVFSLTSVFVCVSSAVGPLLMAALIDNDAGTAACNTFFHLASGICLAGCGLCIVITPRGRRRRAKRQSLRVGSQSSILDGTME
eukprot:gene13777-18106_t